MTRQGGGVSPSQKTVKLGDLYGDLPIPTREGYTFNRWVETGKNRAQKNELTITADSSSGTTLGYVPITVTSLAIQYVFAVSFDYKITARDSNISSIGVKAKFFSNTTSSTENSEYSNLAMGTWHRYAKVLSVETSLWYNVPVGLYIACPNVAGTLSMEVKNIQIETGSTITDYEPYEYTSTTQYTKVGDQTLKAIWTANDYTLTLYENKNILKGASLSSQSDLSYWQDDLWNSEYDPSLLSQQIVTVDGKQCVKLSVSCSNGDLLRQRVTSVVKADTEYIISAEIKTDSANITDSGFLSFSVSANSSLGAWDIVMDRIYIPHKNQEWQVITTTRTTYNFTTLNYACFVLECASSNTFYVKNISMAESVNKSTTATYGSAKTVSTLTYDGHTFLGYYTQPVGGVKIFDAEGNAVANVSGYTDASGKWIRAENVSLYAQWQ